MSAASFNRCQPALLVPGAGAIALPLYAPNFGEAVPRIADPPVDLCSPHALTVAPQPCGGFVVARQRVFQCAHDACTQRTRILPYCARHTLEVLCLEVRPSSIAGAGLGLFAAWPQASFAPERTHHHDYHEDAPPSTSSPLPSPLAPPLADAPVVFHNGDLIYYMEGELLSWKQYEARYAAHLDPSGNLWFTVRSSLFLTLSRGSHLVAVDRNCTHTFHHPLLHDVLCSRTRRAFQTAASSTRSACAACSRAPTTRAMRRS